MDRKRRNTLIIFAVVFAAALAVSVYRNFRPGIHIGERFFYKVSDNAYSRNKNNNISFNKTESETDFDILLFGEVQSAKLRRDEDRVSITYSDGTEIRGIWNADQQHLCDDKDFYLYLSDMSVSVSGEKPRIGEYTLGDALCKLDEGSTEKRGSVLLLLLGCIVYATGMLAFLCPNDFHFLFSSWAYKNAELSDAGILWEKIGGVLISASGIVLIMNIML